MDSLRIEFACSSRKSALAIFFALAAVLDFGGSIGLGLEPLPFKQEIESFRDDEKGEIYFSVRLEQPFLAEEFESSNYLRLTPLDESSYLVYPHETRFERKHAEFFGRMRGAGTAKLRLSYETVNENADGTRRLETSHGDLEIPIPAESGGSPTIRTAWADRQNAYYLNLLAYYPNESFFQYLLLQSRERYGVNPPDWSAVAAPAAAADFARYQMFTRSLSIQGALQRSTLGAPPNLGDQIVPIDTVASPPWRPRDYAALLEHKLKEEKVEPKPHELARFTPADQYFLWFRSQRDVNEAFDFISSWGDEFGRLFAAQAWDNHLREKFDEQLCLRNESLVELCDKGVIGELALTGADPFVIEGSDLTYLLRVSDPAAFRAVFAATTAEAKARRPDLVERDFHYRGHTVAVRYTDDRSISSFHVEHEDLVVVSNSHRAARAVIDAIVGKSPRLSEAPDYLYITTLAPPAPDARGGFLYASEAFLKRNLGPAAKISEKRRVQCFNNLVMLNNASLFYRLEYGKSPASLTALSDGKFIDLGRVVCPHGGAYAFDPEHDAATCSLHNRPRLLTPNSELTTRLISPAEQREYEEYKSKYAYDWQGLFTPLAARLTLDRTIEVEFHVPTLANGDWDRTIRASLAERAAPLGAAKTAPSAIASLSAVVGRERILGWLKSIPGASETFDADPTLGDPRWLGDRVSIHVGDEDLLLEIDPVRLTQLDSVPPFGIRIGAYEQSLAAAAIWATEMPVYVSIDLEDRDKAADLLQGLESRAFLQKGSIAGLGAAVDSYRAPDHHGLAIHVLTFQWYAFKARLHLAIVGDQLVASTQLGTLREVIDASFDATDRPPTMAHAMVRFHRQAAVKLAAELETYWSEKSRLACHNNAISIQNLLKLYGAPISEIDRLSDAKYGVTYFCPEGGEYHHDADKDQVICDVHGNRQSAKQHPREGMPSSFRRFFDGIDELTASLLLREEESIVTLRIERAEKRMDQ